MGKFILIMALIFVALSFTCSAIRINEIMYNPEGDDNNKEFIEIYMEQFINLSGWKIADSSSNDILKLAYYSPTNTNYVLITEDGFNFAGIDATIYSAGSTIGNDLGNTMDSVYLYDSNGSLMDTVSYDGTIANGNGRTMEYVDGNWVESYYNGGTPGEENYVPEINNTDTDNQTNSTDDIDANSTECRPIIVVYTDKEIYNNTDKVNIYFALYNESFPFIIEYWIEDSAGNIVKSKYNTTNTDKKTWTPVLDEKDGVFYAKANIYINCGHAGTGYSESMFIVINGNSGKSKDSSITIKEVYSGTDGKAEFGQPLRINFEIYKGDITKSSVEFWIEDGNGAKVSQTTSIAVYDKFTEYDITVPLQLKTNCNNDYNSGQYTLVAEGLDLRAEEDVNIEGLTRSLCPSQTSQSSAAKETANTASKTYETKEAEQKISYQLLNFNSGISEGKEAINELLIQNDDGAHNFEIWSYIYRGSKSYSGEREGNKQSIELSPYESAIIELKNTIKNAEPGDYKFKVKIRKDDQKTSNEITKDVSVSKIKEESIKNGSDEVNGQLKDAVNSNLLSGATGKTVYESGSAGSKKLSLVLIILSIFIVSLIAVKNRLNRLKNSRKWPKWAYKWVRRGGRYKENL